VGRLQGAGRDVRTRGGIVDKHHVHVAAEALNRGARAAIWHLVELDARRLLEQHGGEMERVADAGVREMGTRTNRNLSLSYEK
jgi:hypothetical protein